MRFQFEDFLLDQNNFALYQDGTAIGAEPQQIELLLLLIERRNRMVSKEELNNEIWKGRVVSEAALSGAIKSLRKLLNDDGRTQRIIKTVHRKGFRFVADVHVLSQPLDANLQAHAKHGSAQQFSSARVQLAKPRIIVLPFINLSADPEQEYFSDGVSTDIIAQLSRHRWLDVIARNASFGYKGENVSTELLAAELNVDYVVEGSIQRRGERVRISAHLIDASTGTQKWAERFNRELDNMFALQDEITELIVARLEPEIGMVERTKVVMARPSSLQAWDCYHLGIYHFFKFTGPDNLEAQKYLLQSQQLDENFGEAYAWWAYAVVLGMVYWQTDPEPSLLDRALAACDRALSLDNHNAMFFALKARVLLARRDYRNAITENERAIQLNPALASAYCGLGDSLAYEEKYDQALGYFDKAISLSPNDPQLWAFYTYGALVHLFKSDYQKALDWTEKAHALTNSQYWTSAHRMVALALLGRHDEAAEQKKRLLSEEPNFSQAFAQRKLFYLKSSTQIEAYLAGLRLAGIN